MNFAAAHLSGWWRAPGKRVWWWCKWCHLRETMHQTPAGIMGSRDCKHDYIIEFSLVSKEVSIKYCISLFVNNFKRCWVRIVPTERRQQYFLGLEIDNVNMKQLSGYWWYRCEIMSNNRGQHILCWQSGSYFKNNIMFQIFICRSIIVNINHLVERQFLKVRMPKKLKQVEITGVRTSC